MIEAIESAERQKSNLTVFLSRSGCHPCDRSEAGHQLSIVNKKIYALSKRADLLKG